jgi:hypothetical protein
MMAGWLLQALVARPIQKHYSSHLRISGEN